jgi:phenylalanyl-tRNA synthetase beta chain
LEAANFDAVNIRRTRTRLGVKTESSDRFEKEVDPNLAEKAMTRVIEILERIAGGKLEGVVDIYPKKIKPWKIGLDLDYVENLLGENVSVKDVTRILNFLGMETKSKKAKTLEVTIPTFRIDLKTPEDLIEEIGRIWGYEKIEARPMIAPVLSADKNEILFFERRVGEVVVGLGFSEMYNYSFYSNEDADHCGLAEIKHFSLANPMNPDQELVRLNLVPNVLKNIKLNLKNFPEFAIFEIGRVYFPNNGKVEEKRMLMLTEVLEKDDDAKTFFALKGTVESMLKNLGVSNSSSKNQNRKF